MVIAPGKNGISAFVILSDDECLPANFNVASVVVMRRGKSTDDQLLVVKPLGKFADPSLLRGSNEAICNYQGDGPPIHEHSDGSWWFFESTYTFERGPFDSYDSAYTALVEYCEEVQNNLKNILTNESDSGKV